MKCIYMRYEFSVRNNNPQAGCKDQTLTLPSGVEIPFRVVRPDDAPALQRLHSRCSERTIYLRFFGPMKELSDEKARYFASTDSSDHFGLVALDPEDPNQIIAVVRYARKPGDERAEYAALVEDRWQGQGIGASLTHRLIEEARGNEVRSFYALVKGANRRMLNVFRHLGLPEQERVEDGEKMVEIGLTS
jgi:RimJ/RimL family protein N-acetyltransferase